MAQVLEGLKTFYIMMTKNDDIEYIDGNINKEVQELKTQESKRIATLEKEVGEHYIQLEDGIDVEKVKVDLKAAHEAAKKQVRTKQSDEKQIGD